MQRYRHIRSPLSSLHSSTLSLPLIFISSVHFYCDLQSFGAPFITWIGNWTIKTHTIFSIIQYGNQTRHIYLSTSKAYAATIPPPPIPLSWTPTYGSFFRQNRRHSCLRRHTHGPSRYISPLGTSTGSWGTSSRLNKKKKWSPSVLRVNTFIVTVFVSLHFYTLLSSHHSSFSSLSLIHHFHHVHSP